MGPKVSVERTQHIVAGDRRCTYLIETRSALRDAARRVDEQRRGSSKPYESSRGPRRANPVFTSSCPKYGSAGDEQRGEAEHDAPTRLRSVARRR